MKNIVNPTKMLPFLLMAIALLTLPKNTFAQGTSLMISPSVFRIEAKPPADIWTPFTIENRSDQPISLKIGYKQIDPYASSNGNVVFMQDGQMVTGPDKKIFDKIQVVDEQNISHDTINLGPQQNERLRFHILLPASEAPGDYYFSLVFLENSQNKDQTITNTDTEDQRSLSSLRTGIGTTVLLAIGPKVAPNGIIQTFSSPLFISKGPVPFTLSVHNSGVHFITPHGQILIKNFFGQTVGKVTVPNETILAGTDRTFLGTNSPVTASIAFTIDNASQNTSAGLVWNEHLLVGEYTATLTLTLSNKGPVYVRTIHFIAFPVDFLLEFLLILLAAWYIFIRVKGKLSR